MASNPRKVAARRYHHGNLRQELIDQAIAHVRANGASGLTMRGLADAVGVSANAPYRHFADLEALLDEVTAFSITLLHEDCRTALLAEGSASDALLAVAAAWLRWASEEPHLMPLAADLHRLSHAPEGSALRTAQPLLWAVVFDAFAAVYPGEDNTAIARRVLVFTSTLYGYILMYKNAGARLRELPFDAAAADRTMILAATGLCFA